MGQVIEKRSPLTGKWNKMEINCTYEQFARWREGGLIQNVMPQLSADEREFLISGCMPGEFEKLMGPENEF